MKVGGVLGRFVLVILSLVVGLAVLEGGSSLVLLMMDAWRRPGRGMAGGHYTRYDTLVGWVNQPNIAIANEYGPGISFHTNAHGFRGLRDIDTSDATSRIICSGDSFTLGYGVADDQTWCAILGTLDPALSTINMGQGAYGIDQAFLWYMRDGLKLSPRTHVFAFIADDFHRMNLDVWGGGAKPRLAVRHDSLVTIGVPVPPQAGRPHLIGRLFSIATLRASRTSELFDHLVGGNHTAAVSMDAANPRTLATASRVFAELRRADAACGTKLLLVFLPWPGDYDAGAGPADSLRAFARHAADSLGIGYLDVVERVRKLPRADAMKLFIQTSPTGFPDSHGHFNADGNRWAAQQIASALAVLHAVPPPATPRCTGTVVAR